MPDPAAMHRCRAAGAPGRGGTGRSASAPRSRRPARTLVRPASRRTARPGSRARRPAGGAPAGAQIEYERRSSTPSTIRRSVSDCPAAKAKSSGRSSGTSKVTATASSQSRSTARHLQRVEGVGHQISFTCSNGSGRPCSGRAPCRRWRRTPRSARRRSEPHRGQATVRRVGAEGQRDRPGRTAAPARAADDAVLGERPPAALGDPVARPGRAEARCATSDVGVPGVGERGAPGRRAWWPSPGSRSRSG